MNLYEMISRESTNCSDSEISLTNKNPYYERISFLNSHMTNFLGRFGCRSWFEL